MASEKLQATSEWSLHGLLIGLMIPIGMTTLNMSMFGVALPAIRDSFGIAPDVVAWISTAYSLPFVVFMPLYGKLGDGLGKDKLFLGGIALFSLGSLLCFFANGLNLLLAGRVLQGIGTAGINPLCLAIIADAFPADQQGKAMGTWSSVGPGASMLGPLLGGFAVDYLGWNYIFLMSIVAAIIAFYFVNRHIPSLQEKRPPGFLREFDWLGVLLLGGFLIFLIFYLSSRALTGVEPLRDWRLLAATIFCGVAFWQWEKRAKTPIVNLQLYAIKNFGTSSFAGGLRMFVMGSMGFLKVLYLADIYGLDATGLGLFTTVYAGAILATTRLGGQLADGRYARRVLLISFAMQFVMLAGLASITLPAWAAMGLMLGQGIGAGLALASLHRIAMRDVPSTETSSAAGLYSTARFAGSTFGAAIAGVSLQQAELIMPQAGAYQLVFGLVAASCLVSLVVSWRMKK
ncbi:MAG: MFS transporter [Caldilineaceae bacterium]|nr:MFS transporter [Caldilineaceae bacterium]